MALSKKNKRPKMSSGGLVVTASTAKQKEAMPEPTDECSMVPMSKSKVAYDCGHKSWQKFGHNFFGLVHEVSEEILEKHQKCGACMLDEVRPLVIRCAACGHVILPGESVALYVNNGSFNEKWTTTTGESGETVIGCLRMGCCPSGGFFAGHWDGGKFVSAFEHGSAATEAMKTGRVVFAETDKK